MTHYSFNVLLVEFVVEGFFDVRLFLLDVFLGGHGYVGLLGRVQPFLVLGFSEFLVGDEFEAKDALLFAMANSQSL